jgi:hypothetical protein
MYFREHGVDFREADRRYAELKRRLDAGIISAKEFDAQRLRLMVKDDEGRWWAKGRKEGERSYRAEGGWLRGTPPGDQPPFAHGASGRWSQLEHTKPFPRGAGYSISARSCRTPSRMNRSTTSDPRQPTTERSKWRIPQTLWPRCRKLKSTKRSTDAKRFGEL